MPEKKLAEWALIVALDDDYHHVYCRDNIVSIISHVCYSNTFTFIIQIIK